jgi:hypothetical protein
MLASPSRLVLGARARAARNHLLPEDVARIAEFNPCDGDRPGDCAELTLETLSEWLVCVTGPFWHLLDR